MACRCMTIIFKPLFATLLAIHIHRHKPLYLLCHLISRSTDTTNIFIYYTWDRIASGTGREKLLDGAFSEDSYKHALRSMVFTLLYFYPLFDIYREHDTPFLILMASRLLLIWSGLGRFLVILIGDGRAVLGTLRITPFFPLLILSSSWTFLRVGPSSYRFPNIFIFILFFLHGAGLYQI